MEVDVGGTGDGDGASLSCIIWPDSYELYML